MHRDINGARDILLKSLGVIPFATAAQSCQTHKTAIGQTHPAWSDGNALKSVYLCSRWGTTFAE